MSCATCAAGGQLWRTYYYAGGQRIAMRERAATTDKLTYLHGDHLGSASLATDASGGVLSEMRYTPYGETHAGDMATDRRYTGQRWEDGIGLYDYNARYYDPVLGRFISADTLVPNPGDPQSLNRYAYVLNNPLKYIDPSGHDLVIVGGKGGNFSADNWEGWIRAYKGWDEEEWAVLREGWDSLLLNRETTSFEDLNSLLELHGIHIFGWGASTIAKGYTFANGSAHVTMSMVELLSSEMEGMQDITLLGWSKGANLVGLYLHTLPLNKSLVQPNHVVMFGQPNATEVPIVGPAARKWGDKQFGVSKVTNNFPQVAGTNAAWLCVTGDLCCAGRARNAINYTGDVFGVEGHSSYGSRFIAVRVLSDLQVATDHGAWNYGGWSR